MNTLNVLGYDMPTIASEQKFIWQRILREQDLTRQRVPNILTERVTFHRRIAASYGIHIDS